MSAFRYFVNFLQIDALKGQTKPAQCNALGTKKICKSPVSAAEPFA